MRHPLLALFMLPPLMAMNGQFPGHNGLETVDWPSAWTTQFDSVEAADVDGDGTLDAVVLESQRLVLLRAVDLVSAAMELPSSGGEPLDQVDAFTLLRDGASFGTQDGICAIRPVGLEIYRWNGSTFALDFSQGGAWIGATSIAQVDWDGDGYTDLVGLEAGRSSLVIQPRTAQGGWASQFSVALPSSVDAFEPVQLDATDSELELALIGSNTLELYDPSSSTVLDSRSSVFATTHVARVEDYGSTDHVAWAIGPDQNGSSYLLIFDAAGLSELHPFVGLTVSGIHSALVDDGSDADLTLTFSDSWDVALLVHQGQPSPGGPTNLYDSSTGLHWIEAMPPVVPAGLYGYGLAPTSGDANLDGDTDLLVPGHDGLTLLHGSFQEEELNQPRQLVHGSTTVCLQGQDILLSIEMDYPGVGEFGADEFRAILFTQADASSDVDEVAFSNCSLDTAGPYELDFLLTYEGITWEDDPRLFHMAVLPVNANDEVVGPGVTGTFTMDLAALYALQPEIWSTPDEVKDTELSSCSQGMPGSGGAIIGGTQNVARVQNPFGPTGEPVWKSVTHCPTGS